MILVMATILLNIIKKIPSCPSQSSNIDIHDLQKKAGTSRSETSPCRSESGISFACLSSNQTRILSNQRIHDHCNICQYNLLPVIDWNHPMLQKWNRICGESNTGD